MQKSPKRILLEITAPNYSCLEIGIAGKDQLVGAYPRELQHRKIQSEGREVCCDIQECSLLCRAEGTPRHAGFVEQAGLGIVENDVLVALDTSYVTNSS